MDEDLLYPEPTQLTITTPIHPMIMRNHTYLGIRPEADPVRASDRSVPRIEQN